MEYKYSISCDLLLDSLNPIGFINYFAQTFTKLIHCGISDFPCLSIHHSAIIYYRSVKQNKDPTHQMSDDASLHI